MENGTINYGSKNNIQYRNMKKERLSMQLDEKSSVILNELCTHFNCNKSQLTGKAFF